MPFKQPCACGKTLLLKDEFAGRKVRCPNCKEIVLAAPPEEPKAEEKVPELDVEEVAVTATPPVVTAAPPSVEFEEDDRPRSRSKRRDEDDEDYEEVDRRRRRRRGEDDDDHDVDGLRLKRPDIMATPSESSNTTPIATIGTGILMMIGAVVWFVGALVLFDRLFIYPPIMFVLGIIAVFRGATQCVNDGPQGPSEES